MVAHPALGEGLVAHNPLISRVGRTMRDRPGIDRTSQADVGIPEGESPTGKRRLSERLGAPEEVFEDAVDLYEEVSGSETVAPHADVLPIAVIYIAVRQRGVARTIDEIASVADVSTRRVYQAARLVSDELDQAIPPAEPEMYVSRLAEEFELPPEIERRARDGLDDARRAGYHAGRDPAALAAAAVYAILLEHGGPDVTQRDLCRATDSHPRTVRESYRELREFAAPDGGE